MVEEKGDLGSAELANYKSEPVAAAPKKEEAPK